VISGIEVTQMAGGLPAYGRGLNVVVLDETGGTPLQAACLCHYPIDRFSGMAYVALETFTIWIESFGGYVTRVGPMIRLSPILRSAL
jgi:hypothetical protein